MQRKVEKLLSDAAVFAVVAECACVAVKIEEEEEVETDVAVGADYAAVCEVFVSEVVTVVVAAASVFGSILKVVVEPESATAVSVEAVATFAFATVVDSVAVATVVD